MLSLEPLSLSQVEPDFTNETLEFNPIRLHIPQYPYLEITDNDEYNRAYEEPHYHEIHDSEVQESQVVSAEQRSTVNVTDKTAYQSLESATRDVPRTEFTPVYAELRTNETAFVERT